ncbi:uncharacterized protein PV06_05791 [Exophiala oligosperma]|uniref:Dihydrodipicolinate synthase n=1 Tax=Exophiala oligosperma TaxID=215243 RepID=A0A0D2BXH8_9EURO|nr:uncharacterized protein PV06_05791 [Exophiala oligosperma]KIW42227.1 hypothetical protein PV06_05791 [Exophiala oligosperma]
MLSERRTLKPGVSVATVTLFNTKDEEIDVVAMKKHVVRLAKAGVNSIVLAGSNGEGAHLSHEEKTALIRAIRGTLDAAGFGRLPIISNCSAQSIHEASSFCREFHEAGADYALILPPCYFKGAYSRQNIIDFYEEIATVSPIPVIIYNYPPVVSGTDLDSDLIIKLASHPNITGCKFTCANMGKITRVASTVGENTSSSPESGFHALVGLADCIASTLTAGGTGVIVGLGNVLPKSCVKLFDLCVGGGKPEEIRKLQQLLAHTDGTLVAGGVTSVKSVLQTYFGYGGNPRRPLPQASPTDAKSWAEAIKEAIDYENSI